MKEESKEKDFTKPAYYKRKLYNPEFVIGGGETTRDVVIEGDDDMEVDENKPEENKLNKWLTNTKEGYAPISFLDDEPTEIDEDNIDDNIKFTKKDSKFRADVIMEDVENGQNSAVFHTYSEDGQTHFKEKEWYFIQLPQFLNMTTSDKSNEQNILRRIPAGKIGKLRVHKSGKISMVLSPPQNESTDIKNVQKFEKEKEVVYNVNHGVKQTFYNEMAHISGENDSITFLPKVSNKVVISPDIASML